MLAGPHQARDLSRPGRRRRRIVGVVPVALPQWQIAAFRSPWGVFMRGASVLVAVSVLSILTGAAHSQTGRPGARGGRPVTEIQPGESCPEGTTEIRPRSCMAPDLPAPSNVNEGADGIPEFHGAYPSSKSAGHFGLISLRNEKATSTPDYSQWITHGPSPSCMAST